MDQTAVMFGGTQLPLTISAEEEEKFPEAVKCFRSILSRLGPLGEILESRAQFEDDLAGIQEVEIKRRVEHLFLWALKEVLNEECRNGYTKIPQELVEKMLDHVHITEMQQKFKGDIADVLGLLVSPTPLLSLSASDKEYLIKAISAKVMELRGPTDDKQKLQEAQARLQNTLSACHEKATEVKELSQNHEILMQKLIQGSDKMELEEMQMQIMKLKMEIDVYKKKIAEVRLAQELFGGVKGEALTKLVSQKQESLQQAKADNKGLRARLAQYASLPQPDFQLLVTQHLEVAKKVENAKWSLQKLEEQ